MNGVDHIRDKFLEEKNPNHLWHQRPLDFAKLRSVSQVQIMSGGMLVVTKIGTADNDLPTCCNQRLSGSLLLLLLLVLVCSRITITSLPSY